MFGIGTKLGLGIGMLLALCVIIGVVSYTQTRAVNEKLEEVRELREPVDSAANGMERNLLETASATLGFFATGDVNLRTAIHKGVADRGGYRWAYIGLMDSQTDSSFANRLLDMIARFHALAEEQIEMRDRQSALLAALRKDLDGTNRLMVDKIRASVNAENPLAYRRLQAVLGMQVEVNTATKSLGDFLLTGESAYEERIHASEREFDQHFQVYKVVLLSSEERMWCADLRKRFDQTMVQTRSLIELQKRRKAHLAGFLAAYRDLGSVIHDPVRTRTEERLAKARLDLQVAGRVANSRVLAVVLVSIVFGIGAGIFTTRSITTPLRRLVSVMNDFEDGRPVRKVELRSSDEFRRVGDAFNTMTGRLVSANNELRNEIAERRRAEQDLRMSEERFRLSIESVRDYGIFMLDPDGRVASWNAGAERMKGFRADEIVGRHFSLFYPAEDIQSGKPDDELRTSAEHGTVEQEGWLLRNNGSRFRANTVITSVRDEAGVLRGYLRVTRDITEQKAMEEKLRQSELRFRTIFEDAPIGIALADGEGSLIQTNTALQDMLCHSSQELAGKNIAGLIHPDDATANEPLFSALRTTEPGRYRLEIKYMRPDRRTSWINMNVSRIHGENGHPPNSIMMMEDITEQKHLLRQIAEAEEERVSGLRLFASSVQHAQEEERARISRELHDDICQRLSGMKFHVEVLEGTVPPLGKRVTKQLRDVRLELDKSITEVRRISSNLRPSVLDDFGLITALRLLSKDFEHRHGMKTTLDLDSVLPDVVDAKIEIAVYRIAQEALSNIAQHSGATTAALSLQVRGNNLCLLVRDNGKGFLSEQLMPMNSTGRGLGLMSMRERSELLGGSFTINSMRDKGTTVTVNIPLGEE